MRELGDEDSSGTGRRDLGPGRGLETQSSCQRSQCEPVHQRNVVLYTRRLTLSLMTTIKYTNKYTSMRMESNTAGGGVGGEW